MGKTAGDSQYEKGEEAREGRSLAYRNLSVSQGPNLGEQKQGPCFTGVPH